MKETETKTKPASRHRPAMQKRVETKEDGRTLIYYTFAEAQPAEKQQGASTK